MSSATTSVPEGLPADVRAAWPAMCPPVRANYALDARPNRARAFALAWLRWEARRRLKQAAPRAPEQVARGARILAIRPDHFGDALLTTPAWTLLKQAMPEAEIDVLAGPLAADVAEHCPAVSHVRVLRLPALARERQDRSPLAKLRRGVAPYTTLFATASEVARERYDLAIDFPAHFWWGAVLGALAAIPHRLGYATAEAAPFLTRPLPLPPAPVGAAARDEARPHVAEQNLALAREALRALGLSEPQSFDTRLVYEPAAADRAEAWRLWRANELDDAPVVVAIHPAPGAPDKRWPPARFALLADHLSGRYNARIVITGGAGDVEEARQIAQACWRKPVVLAGQTSFGALAALLERCRFVIGTDNGALHLATARNVPTLRLFGPIDPRVWHGWTGAGNGTAGPAPALSIQSEVACAPCHRLDVPPWDVATGAHEVAYPCMQEIGVDRVIAAVEQLWTLTSARKAARER